MHSSSENNSHVFNPFCWEYCLYLYNVTRICFCLNDYHLHWCFLRNHHFLGELLSKLSNGLLASTSVQILSLLNYPSVDFFILVQFQFHIHKNMDYYEELQCIHHEPVKILHLMCYTYSNLFPFPSISKTLKNLSSSRALVAHL